MESLENRRALITGGASGIGLATAGLLLERGARVLVVDVQDPPDDLGAVAVRGDVRRSEEWRRIAGVAEQELGGLDLLFLNAGVASIEPDITAIDDDEYLRVLEINVSGVFLGLRELIPLLTADGGGSVVATSSLAGLIAYSPDPLYTLTKHAVIGIVRSMAPWLGERGVTINAVCPGVTDTAIVDEGMRTSMAAADFPMIQPGAIAEAVVGLFSGSDTGGAWVCQYGREPIRYAFRGVPGPADHRPPPAEISGV